jgi:hypothetical protein
MEINLDHEAVVVSDVYKVVIHRRWGKPIEIALEADSLLLTPKEMIELVAEVRQKKSLQEKLGRAAVDMRERKKYLFTPKERKKKKKTSVCR